MSNSFHLETILILYILVKMTSNYVNTFFLWFFEQRLNVLHLSCQNHPKRPRVVKNSTKTSSNCKNPLKRPPKFAKIKWTLHMKPTIEKSKFILIPPLEAENCIVGKTCRTHSPRTSFRGTFSRKVLRKCQSLWEISYECQKRY